MPQGYAKFDVYCGREDGDRAAAWELASWMAGFETVNQWLAHLADDAAIYPAGRETGKVILDAIKDAQAQLTPTSGSAIQHTPREGVRMTIETVAGVVRGHVENGCLLWRAASVQGATDAPTGWGWHRDEWTQADLASWHKVIDEIVDTLLDYSS